MNLSKIEKLLLILTGAFVVFLAGLYVGRNMAAHTVTVYTQNSETALARTDESIDSESVAASGNAASALPVQSVVTQVNLNSATSAELMILPGIGEVLAERIISYRQKHGAFSAVEEIMNVSGIGEGKFEAIKDFISVG